MIMCSEAEKWEEMSSKDALADYAYLKPPKAETIK